MRQKFFFSSLFFFFFFFLIFLKNSNCQVELDRGRKKKDSASFFLSLFLVCRVAPSRASANLSDKREGVKPIEFKLTTFKQNLGTYDLVLQ